MTKLDRLALILTPLRDGLWGWVSVMERIVAFRSAFQNNLGDLAYRTREAATRQGGDLTVGRRVEDRARVPSECATWAATWK